MPLEPGDNHSAPVIAELHRRPWYSKLFSVCLVIFCFEIGIFLVVFPWLDSVWEVNRVANFAPWLADLWGNPFFRGALSGLGLLNIYISFLEILRLIRGQMSPRPEARL